MNTASVATCQWLAASRAFETASRDSGRMRRTRSSTLPSSSVRLEAGAASAARFELAFTRKGEPELLASARTASRLVGSFLSSRLIVSREVVAPVRSWVCSTCRPVTARLSAIERLKADIVSAGGDSTLDADG